MIFEVEVAGRLRRVSIEPVGHAGRAGGRFRLTLDGGADGPRRSIVDARRTELGWSICYEDGRRVVDAAVTEGARGEMLIQLPHVGGTAVVDGRRRERANAAAHAAGGGERIAAPMPGRIVRVLVAVGDEVTAGQGLVVVEAMKMENALAASSAARVVEVAVVEGQSVEAGKLLVRLEK